MADIPPGFEQVNNFESLVPDNDVVILAISKVNPNIRYKGHVTVQNQGAITLRLIDPGFFGEQVGDTVILLEENNIFYKNDNNAEGGRRKLRRKTSKKSRKVRKSKKASRRR